VTPGRLASALGALAGVGLIIFDEALRISAGAFVAVGLASLLSVVIFVSRVDGQRGTGRCPSERS